MIGHTEPVDAGKYRLLNELPDWCYTKEELKDFIVKADLVLDGNMYRSLMLEHEEDEKKVLSFIDSII